MAQLQKKKTIRNKVCVFLFFLSNWVMILRKPSLAPQSSHLVIWFYFIQRKNISTADGSKTGQLIPNQSLWHYKVKMKQFVPFISVVDIQHKTRYYLQSEFISILFLQCVLYPCRCHKVILTEKIELLKPKLYLWGFLSFLHLKYF